MQIVTLIGSVITGTAGFGAAWRCTPCMHMLLIFQPAQELSSTVHAESAPMSRVQHDRCVLPPVSVHTGVYLEGALCSENSPAFTALAVSYTHLRAHETGRNLVCRLLLEKKNK